MRGKVAANEWWVRGECNGFELRFPIGTYIYSFHTSPIPVYFVPLSRETTLIEYRSNGPAYAQSIPIIP